jgi:hypothetical protein
MRAQDEINLVRNGTFIMFQFSMLRGLSLPTHVSTMIRRPWDSMT